MTRTTPELAPPSPNFRATPTGGRLATTYDLACNRPHTRRIFSGIGFRTCDPPLFFIGKSLIVSAVVVEEWAITYSLFFLKPMKLKVSFAESRLPYQ
ncbi:hypothetical protein AVEN_186118-1 [Araneus ventricosus]|uniref:Uncharacterized protein n=1 Tax=Araneus ventricosus TaxID=182803 RepID=A0A4Y2V9V3_ARAVE|nr:hypothetical protein AVEN_186118-1 [Araneus ventricosus]